LTLVHKEAVRSRGLAVTTWDSIILSILEIDVLLYQYLAQLYEAGKEFLQEIKTVDTIVERFSVNRSLRIASDIRALEQKILANDVDIVNC